MNMWTIIVKSDIIESSWFKIAAIKKLKTKLTVTIAIPESYKAYLFINTLLIGFCFGNFIVIETFEFIYIPSG